MFSCVWLHFKKCFEKYFLVFSCVLENTIENTFSTCCSHFLDCQTNVKYHSFLNTETQTKPKKKIIKSDHIFSVAKQIYNIIHSSIQKHKQNPEKKNHQIRSNWEKKEEREAIGFNEGLRSARCFTRSRSTLCEIAIAIGAVLRKIAIDAKARSRSTRCFARSQSARCFAKSRSTTWSFSLCASVSRSFSLSFSLCASVSSFLCTSQFRKWFEGKIKMEIIL